MLHYHRTDLNEMVRTHVRRNKFLHLIFQYHFTIAVKIGSSNNPLANRMSSLWLGIKSNISCLPLR